MMPTCLRSLAACVVLASAGMAAGDVRADPAILQRQGAWQAYRDDGPAGPSCGIVSGRQHGFQVIWLPATLIVVFTRPDGPGTSAPLGGRLRFADGSEWQWTPAAAVGSHDPAQRLSGFAVPAADRERFLRAFATAPWLELRSHGARARDWRVDLAGAADVLPAFRACTADVARDGAP